MEIITLKSTLCRYNVEKCVSMGCTVMSHEKMEVVHKLIREGRYREARGIMETEDIDPDVVEKWTQWLDELQKEERLQAGILSEKKSEPLTAFNESSGLVISAVLLVLGGLLLWQAIYIVFTSPSGTFHTFGGMIAIVSGAIGWQWLARAIFPENGTVIGAGVAFFLTAGALAGGLFVYYDDPPTTYILMTFVLIFPAISYVCWHVGHYIGRIIGYILRTLVLPNPNTENK